MAFSIARENVAATLAGYGASFGALASSLSIWQGIELAASLRHHGFRVLRRVAYRASSVGSLPEIAALHLRQRQVAAAMFFSGETSRHFVSLLRAAGLVGAVRDIEAVSISERAAMALRPLPWRRLSVAPLPNQDAMLAMLR